MRAKGYSIDEIKNSFNIAQSTASLWVRGVQLDNRAQTRILELRRLARKRGNATISKRREDKIEEIRRNIRKNFHITTYTQFQQSLLCSLLYWGEGGKTQHRVQFINSDPQMIRVFLSLFRSFYPVDEKRFRVCVHLHEYHDQKGTLMYWSKITDIHLSQFTKPYIKPHTGKTIRDGYHGCIRISYYDTQAFYLLQETYKEFSNWLLMNIKVKC